MSNYMENDPQVLWQNYIRKPAFKKRLVLENFKQPPAAEFQDIALFIAMMAEQSFQSARPKLKAVMTAAAFTKLCDAYRAYTYKIRHGRKNISLTTETLARLKPIATRLGLKEPGQGIDGGLDNLLYYLTSPEEKTSVQQHLISLSQQESTCQSIPASLTVETWLSLFSQRLPAPEQLMLQQVLEQTFTHGWQAREQAESSTALAKARSESTLIKSIKNTKKQ